MTNLQVVRVAMTAARITWEAPDLEGCDSFKGYQIYLSKFEGNKIYQNTFILFFGQMMSNMNVSLNVLSY